MSNETTIWQERYFNPTQTVANGGLTPQSIQALRARYPYLCLVRRFASAEKVYEPVELYTKGRAIVLYDYGDLLKAALPFPGVSAMAHGEQGEGEAEPQPKGKGTLVKQMVDTAYDMIALAVVKGWEGADIMADSTALMQWAAWMHAEDCGFPIEGFMPTAADKAKHARVRKLLGDASRPSARHSEGA